jgi:hypothetical protein
MREKKLINYLKAALKKEHLYSNDELIYMKKELRNLNDKFETIKKITSKGFGN